MSKDYPKPVENGGLDEKILDLLEPHYENIGFTREHAKTSVTFRKFQELIAQEKAKWGQIVLEDVIGPDYFFTDDAMPTEAEKVTQASLNRLLERQRQALAKLLDKVKYHE